MHLVDESLAPSLVTLPRIMFRFTMENPFGEGKSSIYRTVNDKPIFVFGVPNKEDNGEPCKILADVQTVRISTDNRAAREAVQVAKRFAQRESKKVKPDTEILRALMKQYEKNEHVRRLNGMSDEIIEEQLSDGRV